jgi:hypothetical protein
MDIQQAKDRFNEIAERTGILSREKEKLHPSQDERDELLGWAESDDGDSSAGKSDSHNETDNIDKD